ncbi:MAG: MotA/TolQ/ExbB proton channel family protein [Magnetococcales bacterium]|nr:MotA/TolQ/ExbB proton channel family protein [Magnetococcales bacterium]MBF0149524.1 MotA/TolQ/ExbB proton channel family protein [Magnetococcales bacterium]MBF0174401.1 MotA/TolQ/ExbB proton channel family protein [Magnetococcales bacterium]MBF0630814.1 MotA/TolQ/ExbB proton channel family protein [Magnetococcales bacterium]
MDLATIIGIVSAFSVVIFGILMDSGIMLFVNIPSILIVIGGTIATMLIRHKMSDVVGSINVLMRAVFVKAQEPEKVIGQLIDMANIARKDGILALEKIKSDDPFLQGAINHCVDGADPEFLESVLSKELNYLADRHARGMGIWEGVSEMAPAFGMIGTLIGLVQMLANMSDPSSIGPAMAVAILTTLYGSLISNCVAIPLCTKLATYSKDEQTVKQVIIDGMIGIQKGVNPRMLQEALRAALPPSRRDLE